MSLTNKFNPVSCAIRTFDSGAEPQMIAHGGAGIGKFANTLDHENVSTGPAASKFEM